MSDLKICRICLRTECKVYKYDRFQLKPYYEEVMALKVNDKDGLPQYFCYECATMLHKFHKFKEKCYNGQKTLKEISWKGQIKYEAVYKIDRAARNLKSPLEILTVTRRVKTYCTRDSTESIESETESVKIEEERQAKIKDIEIQYMSEDSMVMTDRDDQIDPEIDPVDENLKNIEPNVEVDKKITISVTKDKDVEPKIYEIEPTSPKTVFIDVKKEAIVLKNEEMKTKKGVDVSLKKNNPAFATKRVSVLDGNHWKKTNLTEEEAIKEFRAKSEDPKYSAAAFQCVDCFKGFSKAEMLKRHKQLRHNESLGPLECRFCHMRFKLDCYLRKHMRKHYTKYHCQRCPLVCTLENTALLHEEYHSGNTKKCIHCGEEFKHQSTYYTHLRTHRSEYVCTLCGVSFVSQLGLHMHKKAKHINVEPDSTDTDSEDAEINTYCEKCDIKFETRKAFREHLFHSAMHTDGVEDELDEVSIPRKVLGKRQKERITGQLVRRKTAQITIPPERNRRRKVRKKHRKPTTCHQCGQHFDTQAACLKHHLTEHPRTSFFPPTERHICEICGASLAPGSVAMHQNIHSREKVFPCETCGRSFHSSVGLKRHLVTHTGEKPFACNLCDKRFTQSNSMKLHYRTFHLKQPYPKRNRRKKKDDLPGATEPEEKSTASEDDSDSLPDQEMNSAETEQVQPVPVDRHVPEENMHYLTLS